MAYICGDLLVEILSQLPVKSLVRFKCVSRSWYDLINDPDFIKLHLHRSIQTNSHQTLVFKEPLTSFLYSVDFDTFDHLRIHNDSFRPRYLMPYILGSCNGLFWFTYSYRREQPSSSRLCNPATQSYHKLPCLPNRNECHGWWGYGFGYDSVHDDYKVMCIVKYIITDKDELRVDSGCKTMVYSLKHDSWRIGHNFPYSNFLPRERAAVFANGYLYWFVHQNLPSQKIIGLAISNETFKEVEQPQYESNLGFEMCALDGYLCLVFNCMTQYDLLILKEHGGNWTKLLRIAKDNVFCSSMPIIGSSFEVLGFSKNRKELFYIYDYCYLVSYDLEQRTTRTIDIGGLGICSGPFICVENLISFKKVYQPKI